MNHCPHQVATAAALFVGLSVAAPAEAASLQKINQSDGWAGTSGLPSYVNMYAVAAYFGLDKASGQDSETAACPDAVPGGGGTGGTTS